MPPTAAQDTALSGRGGLKRFTPPLLDQLLPKWLQRTPMVGEHAPRRRRLARRGRRAAVRRLDPSVPTARSFLAGRDAAPVHWKILGLDPLDFQAVGNTRLNHDVACT